MTDSLEKRSQEELLEYYNQRVQEMEIPYGYKVELMGMGMALQESESSSVQSDLEKPPLGLIPKYVHDQERAVEIFDAMYRYSAHDKPIPIEWIVELQDLYQEEWKGERELA